MAASFPREQKVVTVAVGAPMQGVAAFSVPGPPGPPGPSGSGGRTLAFPFATPLLVWNIQHDLGRYPPVWTQDLSGAELIGEVAYVDSNNVTVTWGDPQSGIAFLDG